ncbi:MAG: hypothetical protein ACOVMQ_10865 [Cyclobacteriaceae bacterium]|jgi:hypothetical protein
MAPTWPWDGGICLSPKGNVCWMASADSPAEAAWRRVAGDEGPHDKTENLLSQLT